MVSVVEFFASVYGRDPGRVGETIRLVGLSPVLRKRIGALSKGYGRRLMLALALLTDGWFLDALLIAGLAMTLAATVRYVQDGVRAAGKASTST